MGDRTPLMERVRELERQANVAIANGLHMAARRLLRQADSLRERAENEGQIRTPHNGPYGIADG